MNKKLLTLDDLYDYFIKENKSYNFSSKDDDSSIVVHIDETMTFDEDYDPTLGLLKAHLKSCHLYKNRNHSSIDDDAMTQAIPSFYNRPILGYIHQLSDGSYDFAGHEMIINEDGETEYLEIPLGVIPESCNAELIYDETNKKTYLELDGYIYEDYTKAADILRKKGSSKVSVEIAIDEMNYSATEKVLNIEKFHFLGVTILGTTTDAKEEEISEGMQGAKITISDFSEKNNSIFGAKESNIETLLNSINDKLDKLSLSSIKNLNTKKGGILNMDIEQLFSKYGITAEEINFDYSEMSEEELSHKLEEIYGNPDGIDDDIDNDDNDDDDISEDNCGENILPIEHALTMSDGTIKTFELSYNDKISALANLVNVTYTDHDNDWYEVIVYDDYIIMRSWYSGVTYRQTYTESDDNYTLTGDRVVVTARYLTSEEEDKLDTMLSDYENIKKDLNSYKEKEEKLRKIEIINSADFNIIRESEDFKNIEKDSKNMSADDIQKACDDLLLKYAKRFSSIDSADKNKNSKVVRFRAIEEEQAKGNNPYGQIFQ